MGLIKKLYSNDKRVIFNNILSLGTIKSFDLIIPLLVIPLLISRVGIDNYGKYAFAYAFIFYFLNITQYGFTLSAVRDISQNKDNKEKLNSIFNEVFSTALFLTLTVIILIFILIVSIPALRVEYKMYSFLILLIIGDSLSPNWFFLGVEKMKFITIVNLVSKATYILFIFIFITSGDKYYLIGLCQSAGFLVAGIISFTFAIKKFDLKFSVVKFTSIKKQLKDGLSPFLTLITPLLYANTSIFLTGLFGIPSYVTYIEVGNKVSGAFSSINTILSQVFYPFINRRKEKSKTVNKILIIMGLVTSCLMFLFSEYFINLWLGGNSEEIVIVTKILSLSPFILSLTSAYGVNGLMVLRKDKIYLKIIFIASMIGLISSIILIPYYYYIGAAITIIISRATIGLSSLFCFNKINASRNG